MATLDRQVGASSDDALAWWESSAWQWGTTNPQWIGNPGDGRSKAGGGMRFTNVTIPQGATIVTAYLTLRARDTLDGTVANSKIRGENVDNAATFSTLANYQGRAKTTALVSWNSIPAWTDVNNYNSPEIKTIIQEIVDRGGWASGNALVVFWEDHDGNSSSGAFRTALSYDNNATYAPKLHIEYTIPPQTISPSGITSAEALGALKANFITKPSAIATAEAIGSHNLVFTQNVLPDGVVSAEAMGTSKILFYLLPGGIATGEALGSHKIIVSISPNGIITAEVVPTPEVARYRIQGLVTLSGLGVPDVTVKAIDSVTGAIFSTTTDGSGNYMIVFQINNLQHVVVEYEFGGIKYNAKSLWDVVPA